MHLVLPRCMAALATHLLPTFRLCLAGDLPGMRLAADRVLGALRTLDYAGAPLWRQAQQRLLARLTAPPAGVGGPGDDTNDTSNGTGCGDDDAAVDVEQLAAAVAAAAAAAPAIPLEEEGLPYVEPKAKVGRPRVEACVLRRYFSAAAVLRCQTLHASQCTLACCTTVA